MTSEDRKQYILQTAAQLGLSVPHDELPRVLGMFTVLERAAAQLEQISLADTTIAAAVFRADPGPQT